MIKCPVFLIFFFCIPIHLFSQNSELGIFAGASGYTGELNHYFYRYELIHPAGGVIYRHNWTPHYSLKADALYGRISGSDVAPGADAFMRARNLSFSSLLIEASGEIEFNFFPYFPGRDDLSGATPYIFSGFSMFYFNPVSGSGIALHSAPAEGKSYSIFQPAIPMGMGFKLKAGTATIGMEAGARRTFTDYVDDVSTTYPSGMQRGNSQDTDWYFFTGLTLSLKISGENLKVDCKSFPK